MLVAVALLAVLIGAAYGTFFSVLRGKTGVEEGLDKYLSAGRFLSRFSDEVHGAYCPGAGKVSFFTGDRKGGASLVSFTAYTYPRNGMSPATDLVSVSYFASETEGGKTALFKEAWNPFIGDRVKTELLPDIAGFEVSYNNGHEWVRAWDCRLEGALPKAVKATVILPGGEEMSTTAAPMIR